MPFALECYLFWQLFDIMRRSWSGRNWAIPSTVLALAVVYTLLVFAGIDRITVIWPGN
jgi:hypothetical protein